MRKSGDPEEVVDAFVITIVLLRCKCWMISKESGFSLNPI